MIYISSKAKLITAGVISILISILAILYYHNREERKIPNVTDKHLIENDKELGKKSLDSKLSADSSILGNRSVATMDSKDDSRNDKSSYDQTDKNTTDIVSIEPNSDALTKEEASIKALKSIMK